MAEFINRKALINNLIAGCMPIYEMESINTYFQELRKFAEKNNLKFILCRIEDFPDDREFHDLSGYIECLHDDGKISDHQYCLFSGELDEFSDDLLEFWNAVNSLD